MKKFNISKGLIIGLLTLALCFAAFGAVKASASTITLNHGLGVTGSDGSASDTSGEYTLPTSSVSGWSVPDYLVFDGWSTSESGAKITSPKISVSDDTTLYALWKVKDAALYGSLTYDPETDSIVVKTNYQAGTASFAILKEAASTTLKASNFKASATTTAVSGETAKYGETVYSVSGGFSASVPLSGKNSKLKIAENKDGYIAVTLTPPSGKTTLEKGADITIKKTDVKKVTVNFNYVSAISGGNALAISSVEVVPVDGDKYTSISGDAKWNGLIEKLQYSDDDGKTWYDVWGEAPEENTAEEEEVEPKDGETGKIFPASVGSASAEDTSSSSGAPVDTRLTSGKLFTYTQASKAPKILFRLLGDENPAKRTSKTFKVGVKKAGKPEKDLKINAATNSIVIKNGYDFFVTSDSGEAPSADNFDEWMTILPVGKNITDVDAFKKTNQFVPFKKPDDTVAASKTMFTGTKVKEVTIEKFCEPFGVSASSGDLYIYMRKSAGVGKPAAQWNKAFVLSQQITAPEATIANSGEPTVIAKSGSKNEMKGEFSGSGSNLEVLVIKKTTDVSKIDWSKTKWAKYNTSKGIIYEKTSTKVTVGDASEKVALDKDTYVLVRYAGDKKSKKLASPYVKTAIESSTSGSETTYKWVTVSE